MRWFSDHIDLTMTAEQALSCSHMGACDADVLALSKVPRIRRQTAKLDAEVVRKMLKEYGAWSAEELADHEQNIQRLLWIAAGDIADNLKEKSK